MRAWGIDFGTTNSAIAVADETGAVALASFPPGDWATFRSVLYFDAEEKGPDLRPLTVAGPQAIERYLAEDGQGRLIQSLKSHLASRVFQATQIFSIKYTLEDMVGLIAGHLRRAAEARMGPPPERIVVGRPVRSAGADEPEAEELALRRLKDSLAKGGLPVGRMVFAHEPVAAAYHYESRLERDELVLIADFGGGTSDFCLIRVGPEARKRADGTREILATAGVALAGDAFDGRIVRHLISPELGRGAVYDSMGKEMTVPPWLFSSLERWHHLSFLKSRETLELVRRIERGAQGRDQEKISALLHLIENDRGYHLYRAVEKAKIELSAREEVTFVFDDGDSLRLEKRLTRPDFESWIEPELDAIRDCVDRCLTTAGIPATAVDRVFTTGGSSLIPAVRRIFADRFGEARLAGGNELTAVASGLARMAIDLPHPA